MYIYEILKNKHIKNIKSIIENTSGSTGSGNIATSPSGFDPNGDFGIYQKKSKKKKKKKQIILTR